MILDKIFSWKKFIWKPDLLMIIARYPFPCFFIHFCILQFGRNNNSIVIINSYQPSVKCLVMEWIQT